MLGVFLAEKLIWLRFCQSNVQLYNFTLSIYLSKDCEIVIQLKVFLLYHTCTNSTSNIATHFTIFLFSVKK